MKTIRIFISSPGDVVEERDRARQAVEQLRRRYAGQFDLKAMLWEDLPLQADMSFQQGIDMVLSREQGIDIAVFILWSRLGSPLGTLTRKPDGAEYRSGTEREFDLILAARQQNKQRDPSSDAPKILVYARQDEVSFDERLRGRPTDEKNELLIQKKLVETFIQEEFHDRASGTNVRAYHSFDRPTTFSQRLRVHLQEILDELTGETLGKPVWDVSQKGSPFRGLEVFEPEHSPVFFGREDEVVEVRRALQKKAREGCAFVLISGASGSGKSSLTRAGVLPAVVEYEVDSTVSGWRHAVCTPGQFEGDLCGGMAALLCSDGVLPELRVSEDSVQVLAEGLRVDSKLTVDQSLRPALRRACQSQAGIVRLLLVVDQFEELFTDKRLSALERERFVAALEALARSGVIWVLATVRADFYQHCQSSQALMRMKEGPGQIDLLPPAADALRRLIEQPAWRSGLSFEKKTDGTSLADRILKDATTHAELLPLVSYVLRELFERRTPQGLLTFAAYDQLGGVEGALAKRADTVYNGLPAAARAELSTVLRALVTVSAEEGHDVLRQRVRLATFAPGLPARMLVDHFVAERLLVTDGNIDGEAMVSVAHEALLRVWGEAARWIAENRESLRARARTIARMNMNADAWTNDRMGKKHLLLKRPDLCQANEALDLFPELLPSRTREFIAASDRHRRRGRLFWCVLAALLAVMLGWDGPPHLSIGQTALRGLAAYAVIAPLVLIPLLLPAFDRTPRRFCARSYYWSAWRWTAYTWGLYLFFQLGATLLNPQADRDLTTLIFECVIYALPLLVPVFKWRTYKDILGESLQRPSRPPKTPKVVLLINIALYVAFTTVGIALYLVHCF